MHITRRSTVRLLALAVAAWPLTGCSYNKFVGEEEAIKAQWAQVENQLQRRNDLIPNLVETAKGYMGHERETLTAITDARSRAMGAGTLPERSAAEAQLTGAISKFMLTVENYPDLKANQNFLALQEELTSTENKISFARQAYNDAVLFFNNKIEMFPSNVIAGMFNFRAQEFFEVEEPTQREAPKVQFTR